MSFIADKQTVSDLNLLGKYKPSSIFSLFNQVVTAGGERLLQEMFHHPLSDHLEINRRSSLFSYFQKLELDFPFQKNDFLLAENYFGLGSAGNYPSVIADLLSKKLMASFLHDVQYEQISAGLAAAIRILNTFQGFLLSQSALQQKNGKGITGPYTEEADKVIAIFSRPELSWLEQEDGNITMSLMKVAKYHYILQRSLQKEMEEILNSIYNLDVCMAVSKTGKARGFGYATATPGGQHLLQIDGLSHPGLTKGIANSLLFHKDQNMLFLTGANMAGKSTLMKAFGIAVYLAHMGFPVAASGMNFSVMDGLFSSINVPDDLNMGYSHFYAEVLRVKRVAEEVSAGKNLVVLFDELFKGTNVKDAYDATLSVTRSFSDYRNCFYVISTHIIEVGEALQAETQNLRFAYLPTVMEGSKPRYTYLLEEGITTDRQGMMIIKNEGILEILAKGEM